MYSANFSYLEYKRNLAMTLQASQGLLSPFLQRKRFEQIIPYLHGSVLDIGSGSGDLCKFCDKSTYVGVEIDKESLMLSSEKYPEYKFQSTFPDNSLVFDTIVASAVIEHIKNPIQFMTTIIKYLHSEGKLIITTPHPIGRYILDFGSRFGIFSYDANEEHEHYLRKSDFKTISSLLNLKICLYKRFLYGFNQVCVYKKYKLYVYI